MGKYCDSGIDFIAMVFDNDFLIPPVPLQGEMFPSLGGCPQGGGLYSAKKMNIFCFVRKKVLPLHHQSRIGIFFIIDRV